MKYTKERLGPIVATSSSVNDVLRRLGISITGGNHVTINRAIDRLGLDRSHFRSGGQITAFQTKLHWTEVLIRDRKVYSNQLRRALTESGREYVCECGQGPIWCGRILVLQIDHKDGDVNNNSPDNLRYLCPNCHTQTANYGRAKHTSAKLCACGAKAKSGMCRNCWRGEASKGIPDKSILRELVWQYPATEIAKRYGVTDVAVAKWCKKYGVSKPGKGYWTKK